MFSHIVEYGYHFHIFLLKMYPGLILLQIQYFFIYCYSDSVFWIHKIVENCSSSINTKNRHNIFLPSCRVMIFWSRSGFYYCIRLDIGPDTPFPFIITQLQCILCFYPFLIKQIQCFGITK